MDNAVERAYRVLRDKAMRFELKPGERLKEVELARGLKMSRAPIREAMNRLVTDGLLTFVPNQGFSCRKLSASEIAALYSVRADLEVGGIQEIASRANQDALQTLALFWNDIVSRVEELSIEELVARDEEFHLKLASLGENLERVRLLSHINARIYFVRRINLENETRRCLTLADHGEMLTLLLKGKTEAATDLLRRHLNLCVDEAMEAVRQGLARIYAESVA